MLSILLCEYKKLQLGSTVKKTMKIVCVRLYVFGYVSQGWNTSTVQCYISTGKWRTFNLLKRYSMNWWWWSTVGLIISWSFTLIFIVVFACGRQINSILSVWMGERDRERERKVLVNSIIFVCPVCFNGKIHCIKFNCPYKPSFFSCDVSVCFSKDFSFRRTLVHVLCTWAFEQRFVSLKQQIKSYE